MCQTTETETELCAQLEAFIASEGLPHTEAADLLLHPNLTVAQRGWLTAFMARWEAMEAQDRAGCGL